MSKEREEIEAIAVEERRVSGITWRAGVIMDGESGLDPQVEKVNDTKWKNWLTHPPQENWHIEERGWT